MADGAAQPVPVVLFPAPLILEAVAIELGLDIVDLRGPSHVYGLTTGRQVAACLMLQYTIFSRVQIGAALGRVSNSAGRTLLMGAERRLGKKDERFLAALEQCRQRLFQGNHGS